VKFAIIALSTGIAFVLALWGAERIVRRSENEDTFSTAQDGLEADKAKLAKYRNTSQRNL
jgi:hypothetical protein